MPQQSRAPGSRPRRHPDSAFRAVGDEGGLVVLAGRAEVKVLNPVAIRVFGLLDGSRTLDAIAEVVCGEFDIEKDQALVDVADFVSQLAQHGMLADTSEEVTA